MTIFSKAMSGVITFLVISVYGPTALLFSIYHTKTYFSAQYVFYHFSFCFHEYSYFINSVFHNIFNANSVTNVSNNDFYIAYLFDRDNRFLFFNYKVAGQCINIFHQRKFLIISDNNDFFLVIIFVIFRVFNRKQKEHLKFAIWLFFWLWYYF